MEDVPIDDQPLILAGLILRQTQADTAAMADAFTNTHGKIPERLDRLRRLGRLTIANLAMLLDRLDKQLPTERPRVRERLHPERPPRRR